MQKKLKLECMHYVIAKENVYKNAGVKLDSKKEFIIM